MGCGVHFIHTIAADYTNGSWALWQNKQSLPERSYRIRFLTLALWWDYIVSRGRLRLVSAMPFAGGGLYYFFISLFALSVWYVSLVYEIENSLIVIREPVF